MMTLHNSRKFESPEVSSGGQIGQDRSGRLRNRPDLPIGCVPTPAGLTAPLAHRPERRNASMASRWSKLCLPLAMVCSLFLFPAGALAVEWNSDNIDEVKAELDELVTKVRDLFQRIRHNIPHPPPSGNATNIVTKILEIESNLNGQEAGTVLKELKQQFAELNAQGELIREGCGRYAWIFRPPVARLQDVRGTSRGEMRHRHALQ